VKADDGPTDEPAGIAALTRRNAAFMARLCAPSIVREGTRRPGRDWTRTKEKAT